MGMLKWLIGYEAAKHLLRSTRPQPVNIHIHIEPGDDDEEDCCEGSDSAPYAIPGDGIYVRDDGVHPPRYFNHDGEEVDADGHLL